MEILFEWAPNDTIGVPLIFAAAFMLLRRGDPGPSKWGAWITLIGGALWLVPAIVGPLLPPPLVLWMVTAGKGLPYVGLAILLGLERETRRPSVILLVLCSLPWYFVEAPTSYAMPPATSAGTYSWIGACLLGVALLRLVWLPHAGDERSGPKPLYVFAAVGMWIVVCVYGGLWTAVTDVTARRIVADSPRLPTIAPNAYRERGWDRVEFAASDGVPLVGWWAPTAQPRAVVIVHGYGGNKGRYVKVLEWLNARGWSAFVFDYRTHGESGGTYTSLGVHEQWDLNAAVALVRRKQSAMGDAAAPLVVYGLSLGGVVALHVAAESPDVDGAILEGTPAWNLRVVDDSARFRFGGLAPVVVRPAYRLIQARTGAWLPGLDNLEAITRIAPRPLLIIENEADRGTVEDGAAALYAAAGEPKQLYLAPTRHMSAFSEDAANYEREVMAFLGSFDAPE